MSTIGKGYNAGGYRGTDGRENPLPLQGRVDMKMEPGFFTIKPKTYPTEEPTWDMKYSDLGNGRPIVTGNRYLADDEVTTRIDNDEIARSMVMHHQNGFKATDKGIHGTQWYDPSVIGYNQGTVNLDPKNVNYEGSRFEYGRYDVPNALGYGLPASKSTLQRQKAYITTGYERISGNTQSGYYSGKQGIKNKMGINPTQ